MSEPASRSAIQIHPQVATALRECRSAFWSVAAFSGMVNILMLAGPLYMLQIYDRVLTSRSIPTLVALSAFLVGVYAFQGIFDMIRQRVVVRAAALLDERLDTVVHNAVVRLGVLTRHSGEAQQPVRDLDQIRSFLTSSGPIAIVDLPWMPVFLFVCFLIHPWLGVLALVGGLVLFGVTLLTELASREPSRSYTANAGIRSGLIEAARRNSETVIAMSMTPALAARWTQANDRYLAEAARWSDVVNSFGSISKIFRLLLQSMMLGLGAYLVIKQEMTAGAMIAASLMMGRALAPIETAIGNWRAFVSARQSVVRLSHVLARTLTQLPATVLPKPAHSLQVEQLTLAPPGSTTIICRDINFRLPAGEVLAVIGPSGAGKTSLARALGGIWRPARGAVRLDGAASDQWDADRVGKYIGFLSQNVELFDGSIAENIARMEPSPDSDAVLKAAQVAGTHEMILRLSGAYDTQLGDAGVALSGGQRQRIALARALYGDPFLIVLDEPHANLDGEGEAALLKAIQGAKLRGAIVVIIAHRPAVLSVCDKVLVLANGTQQAFGPRDEIMRKLWPRPVPTTVSPAFKGPGKPDAA